MIGKKYSIESPFVWLTTVVLIFAVGLVIQMMMPFHHDIGFFLHGAQKILDGYKYSQAFFDPNFPLILLFYSIPLVFAKLINIQPFYLLKIILMLLAVASVFICNNLANKLFHDEDKKLKAILIIAITFAFMILPCYSFGEREHILLICSLPYFLLAALRAGVIKVPLSLAIVVGVIAGFGFALKPAFLMPVFIVELYLLVRTKKIVSVFRPELVLIAAVSLVGLGLLLYFAPNYFKIILPITWHLYYVCNTISWPVLLTTSTSLFWLITVWFFFLLYKRDYLTNLSIILLLASVGFIILYLMFRVWWYYHQLPAYGLATILLAFLWGRECLGRVKSKSNVSRQIVITLFIGLAIIYFPLRTSLARIKHYTSSDYMKTLGPLIQYTKANAKGGPIYFFTSSVWPQYPLVNYTNTTSASRFPLLWPLISFVKLPKPLSPELEKEKRIIISYIIADLTKNKPTLLFVDKTKDKTHMGKIKFDYIDYLSKYKKFRDFFKNYRYDRSIYDYAIYVRRG